MAGFVKWFKQRHAAFIGFAAACGAFLHAVDPGASAQIIAVTGTVSGAIGMVAAILSAFDSGAGGVSRG